MTNGAGGVGQGADIKPAVVSGGRARGAWLGFIPAVVAGMLAVVYALGAIAVYGQVKGAGLDAVQTMPLVPIEQILGRGIGSIASIFTQVFLTALVAALMVAGYWSERDERTLAHPSEWSKFLYLGMPGAALFFAIFMPWETAAVLAIGILATLALWALGGLARMGGWRGLLILAGGSIASILPMSIASSLIEPSPLPAVEIVFPNGEQLEGGLVAETGSSWYIARPDHSIRGIPAANVARTVITYPEREPDPSLVDLIF